MDNELLRFARLAVATARRVVPARLSRHAGPTYHPASLLAVLLLKEHLCLTYRAAEDLLRLSGRLRRLLGLRVVPDHSTLWWFGRRHLGPDVIAAVLGETVERAAGRLRGPRLVALDSTGLWLSHASRWFERRAERGRGQRGWLKWALAMWAGPQLLLAQRVRPGPAGDFSDLVPLASSAHAALPFDRLVADAGYDSEANHRFCREVLGVDSLIPAKRRRSVRVVATTPYRLEMVRRLGEPGDEDARRAYRQRWKAETVMSVVKRRWGEALSARLDETQAAQALLRGVVYNLNRLVRLDCAS
jgi:transposase